MKFRFPYVVDKKLPLTNVPRPSYPSGYTGHWRSLVKVRLIGPSGTKRIRRVLVDSGSSETVLLHDHAKLLGVSLASDPTWKMHWRGVTYSVDYGDVALELTDADGKRLRWKSVVGFTKAPLPYNGFLGFLGCLEYMDAMFRGEMLDLELEPTSLFPGDEIPP